MNDNYYYNRIKELSLVSAHPYDFNGIEMTSQKLNCSFNYAGIPIKIKDNRVHCLKDISNTICLGKSGSGKTTSISIPYTIMNLKGGNSMIVIDTKGSNYSQTSSLAKREGYIIKVFNLMDQSHSNHFNPFQIPYKMIKDGKKGEDRGNEMISEVCEMLKERQTTDIFWENSSAQTISGLIQLLIKLNDDNNPPTMSQIIDIMSQGRERCGGSNTYLSELVKNKFSNDRIIQSLLSPYINAPTETKGSIDSVLSEKLGRFARSEQLLNLISDDDLEIENITKTKYILYINLPDYTELHYQLATILVKQIMIFLEREAELKYNGCLPRKVSFLMEEFAQYKISDFQNFFSTSRSRNIEFLIIFQSISQLNDVYGSQVCTTLVDNASIIYLYDKDLDTLEYISKLSGNKIELINEQKVFSPKITVNDLLTLPPNKAVVILDRHQAFYTDLEPYYLCDFNYEVKKVPFPCTKDIERESIDIKLIVDQLRREKMNEFFKSDLDKKKEEEKNQIDEHVIMDDKDVQIILDRIDKKIKELEDEEKEGKEELLEIVESFELDRFYNDF